MGVPFHRKEDATPRIHKGNNWFNLTKIKTHHKESFLKTTSIWNFLTSTGFIAKNNSYKSHKENSLMEKWVKGWKRPLRWRQWCWLPQRGSFILGLSRLQRSSTAQWMPTNPQSQKAGLRACWFSNLSSSTHLRGRGRQGTGPGLVGAGQGGMAGVSRRE